MRKLQVCLLLVAVHFCLAAEQVPIAYEGLEKVSVSLISGVFAEGLRAEAEELIRKSWYMSASADAVVTEIRSQSNKNAANLAAVFGEPRSGVKLLGSSHVGRTITVFYLQAYSGIDVPVKLTYVRREDGFYLCGFM